MGTVVIATSEPAARTVALWLLAGFLGSFIFIRTSARLMRSPKVPWWPGSVTSGDLHIHHLVWGIILLLLCGFLGFATTPITPWTQILAVLFGIGAGFTLDEFALWLRLDDVYWGPEGRRSVDAVLLATLVGLLLLVGFSPFDEDSSSGEVALGISIVLNVLFVLAAVLKGRIVLGVVGLFVPIVALVATCRLARPRSPWARRFYAEGSRRLERSRKRFPDSRRMRWEPVVDLFAGRSPAEAEDVRR